MLPKLSGLPIDVWAPIIRRAEFPKELWPSQLLLGRAGFFSGSSGIIQMPTSACKTRSVEIILRSAFLANRTRVAVVITPFRALCREVSVSLHGAFQRDGIKVNEISDIMQRDFVEEFSEIFGGETSKGRAILVLTPEKFLYVLRQLPFLLADIGLVVYDEGHQFDTGSRGITYELLLTQIKSLLPQSAQTVLVSAVIQNAESVGQWLIGESAKVVNGNDLLPTARSVAFASWTEQLGQLMFFESGEYKKWDYFVPRALERQLLQKRSSKEKARYFPERAETQSTDVSLYLGIRLAGSGAVAIFCGRKSTARSIASRVTEIYQRGYTLAAPATFADQGEVARLKRLIDEHYGSESDVSKAAALGVFLHHGNTPQGLRLAVEHAMQCGLIKFVACTSTLAQGVNLPIRYLIVSGVYQGREKIKVRDFQNLIGRAGRAGHTGRNADPVDHFGDGRRAINRDGFQSHC